jgi:hypothetical protein
MHKKLYNYLYQKRSKTKEYPFSKPKKCTNCHKAKALSEFSRRKNTNKTHRIYFKAQCKTCAVKHTAAWVKKNTEKAKAYQHKWHWEHNNPGKVYPSSKK